MRAANAIVLAARFAVAVLDATAAAGEYPERDLARGLTPQQRSRHFERRGDVFVVREPVRRLIEFRRLNLTRALNGLGPFDLALSPDGKNIYVENANSDTVTVMGAKTQAVKETILVRPDPGLAPHRARADT